MDDDKKKASGSTTAASEVVIEYNHFEHATTGGDAFWVDSYQSLDGTINGGNLARAEVPFYNNISLTDVIDFRGTSAAIDPNGVMEITKV